MIRGGEFQPGKAACTDPPEPSLGSPTSARGLDDPRWRLLLAALILAKLGFLVWYGLHSRWVMDEFAQGYGSHLVDDGLYRVVDPIKSALPEVLFNLSLHRDLSSTQILASWRVETLAAALLVVLLTALMVFELFAKRHLALIGTFVLLAFSNYVEHSFRVRNDSFAILFVVAAILLALRHNAPRLASWGAGALVSLAFLCTQKTAYHAVALCAGQAMLGFGEGHWRAALARVARFSAGFGAAVALYAIAFGGWRFDRVVVALFLSPLRHASVLSGYSSGLGRYIVQTLVRNPAAYALCVLGLAVVLVEWRRLAWRVRATAVVTLLGSVLIFAHQQPWPYVFVMALPLLALWPPLLIERVPQAWQTRALALLLLLLAPSFVRNLRYLEESSRDQLQLVRDAERQLAPGDRYFDGIGMIPTREIAGRYPWWWWDRPNLALLRERWNRGDRAEIEAILRDRPKVWILNYRLNAFERVLAPIWKRGTVRVSEFLLIAGCAMGDGETTFHNSWPGEFRLFEGSGRVATQERQELQVDGYPCATPCRIEAGAHLVSVASGRGLFLLPSDFVAMGSLPHDGPVRDLFAAIYDF